MSGCLNECYIIGFLSSNPEQIHDNPVGVRFKLTTKEIVINKNGNKKILIEEHCIKIWNHNAIYALNNIVKDDLVFIKGKIHYYLYTTDEGIKGINTEIITSTLTKMNRKYSSYSKSLSNNP